MPPKIYLPGEKYIKNILALFMVMRSWTTFKTGAGHQKDQHIIRGCEFPASWPQEGEIEECVQSQGQ